MGTGYCMVRTDPDPFPVDYIKSGLRACGLKLVESAPTPTPTKDDVLVIWNRQGLCNRMATFYESFGAPVIVMENGYLPSSLSHKTVAASLWRHNGAGAWPVTDEDRVAKLGVDLKPWRDDGEFVLMLPQRGIGTPRVAMPLDWPHVMENTLKRLTKRRVVIRKHPGKEKTPLEPALQDCWAAVTWGSGAGIKAIVSGIPVFHSMPEWMGAPAARRLSDDLEDCFLGDRMPMLHRLTHAQYAPEEIANGYAFSRLIAHAQSAGG